MTLFLLVASLLALTGYLFVSGFHDASNAVAIPVRTRALTPRIAVTISALFNVVGLVMCAVFLTGVISPDWLNVPTNNVGLGMLLTALIAQILWSLLTWFLRMPSSSTHALIGGLLGAMWAANAVGLEAEIPFSESFFRFFILPLVFVPLVIFGLSWLAMLPAYRLGQRSTPSEVNRYSRAILSFTNSLISLGHGILSGQRALIVFQLICLSAALDATPLVLLLATLVAALALGAGTLLGGWRIGHTIAHRLVYLDPLRGAVAQTTSALTMILAPFAFNAPVSSSHLTATSALGAGMNQRFSALRLNVTLRLFLTWLATIPATFILAAVFFLALSPTL